MFMKSIVVLGTLTLASLAASAQASPIHRGGSMIEANPFLDVSVEANSKKPRFLVGLQVYGDSRTGDYERTRYFWVTFVGEPGQGDFDGENVQGLSKIELNIVAATEIKEKGKFKPYDYAMEGVRFLPIEYRRDVAMGINHSFTTFALGAMAEGEGLVSQSVGTSFTEFVKIAVDILGLHYMSLTSPNGATGDFGGIKLLRLKGEMGMSSNFNDSVSLRLVYLGIRGDLTIGSGTVVDADNVLMAEMDLYSRIELAFNRGYQSLYVEGGFRTYGIEGSDFSDDYGYVNVGISGVY